MAVRPLALRYLDPVALGPRAPLQGGLCGFSTARPCHQAARAALPPEGARIHARDQRVAGAGPEADSSDCVRKR